MTTQLPGCLPPGYNDNSMLTVEQWAVWQQMSPLTARRYVADMKRAGTVRRTNGRARPLIHVRTYLSSLGPQFRKALE